MSLRSSSSSFPCHVAIVLTVASIVIVIAVPSEADVDSDDLLAVIEKRASNNKQNYCGSHLVDALSVVCEGSYNGMFKKQSKKNLGLLEEELRKQESDPNYLQRQSQDDSYDILHGLPGEPGYAAWITRPDRLPFRERLVARAFSNGALRRKIRGAYDECCANGCTVAQLRLYCSAS